MPEALTVRVITATIGLALTLVNVRAISSQMNNLSPRVVRMGRKPLRYTVGDFNSQSVMAISISTMLVKKTATGRVQAIQSNMFMRSGSCNHWSDGRGRETAPSDHAPVGA